MRELVRELSHQRLVIRSHTAEDVCYRAEIRIRPQVLIGSSKKCVCREGGSVADGTLLLRIVDGESNSSWRGKVDIHKIREAPSPRSKPRDAKHIVIGNLRLNGKVSLMDLRHLEIRIEIVHGGVAAG